MNITARIISNRFPDLARAARGGVRRAIEETAAEIEGEAKSRAPVDTGFLRSSIGYEMTGDDGAVVSVGADYGAYVEYGTHKMAAQSYLTPAAEAARPHLAARLRKILG